MKITAISIFFVLLFFPLVSAIDFNFTSPLEINQNEIFKVNIISNSTSDKYDVKIYVNDDSKEFCEIYDGNEWKSPYYYLVSFYPETAEYSMKAYFLGDTAICVKLRKTGTSSATQVCNPIKVNPSSAEESNEDEEENESKTSESSSQESESAEETEIENSSSQSNQQPSIQSLQISSESNDDRIILNPKQEEKSFITKEQKIRLAMIYVFLFICIMVIIFLSFKKL